MDHDQALSRVLPELSQRMRAAFAGACAERMRALYESVAEDDPEWFFDALGLVWDFAEGKEPDQPALAAMQARVRGMYDDMLEAEESGYEADSLRSLLGALGSITDLTIESAEEAAQFALEPRAEHRSMTITSLERRRKRRSFSSRCWTSSSRGRSLPSS